MPNSVKNISINTDKNMEKEKKERKHKGRYSYLNDFKLNESNEYEYKGNVFESNLSKEEKSDLVKQSAIFHLLLTFSVLIGGFIPYKGLNGDFYVVVPYVFEVIFLLLEYPILYKLYKKDVLREYEYKKSVDRVRPFYYVIVINAAIGIGACIADGLSNGFDPIALSLIYGISKVGSVIFATILANLFKKLSYKQVQYREN